MRIAVDARSLAAPVLRGWDRYTVGLLDALCSSGLEIDLLHRERVPIHAEHIKRLPVRPVALSDRGGLHWEQVALPRALREYDLFHAPAEHGVPLLAPCPVVLTVHSVTLQSYRRLIHRGLLEGPLGAYIPPADLASRVCAGAYFRLQVARADHILTPSAFCRDEVIDLLGVSPRRVSVTPLAPAPEFKGQADSEATSQTLSSLGVRRPFLLYVGGYEPHKNVPGVLRLLSLVRHQRPDLNLVVVGTGEVPDSLGQEARSLGLPAGEVVFLRNLGRELRALYDAAELFVSMSWRESFGLPALEAMTRGLPVVVSGWGAAGEVVGEAGVLVDPTDPEGAALAVLDALHPDRRTMLADRARHRARQFSWHETADRTRDIYERLMGVGVWRMASS